MKTLHLILVLIFISAINLSAQNAPETFQNPILSGYHPDPSVCRVGDDYYLINSTFIWYPGIPIYHSKDLVNWELIGYGIHRPGQLDFEGLPDRQGVYAATIRYHEGKFYIVNTCVGCGGNFYITADDPKGPWSDPVWLEDAPGIDPSLMWDDDEKCYYTGHMGIHEKYQGECAVWTQELDLEQGKLVGERAIHTQGHANNASYTEGPHMYKINGKYLLMVSEGGTGPYHSLTVHHSDSLFGKYTADMINPVITHRHLGKDYPVQAIGHGDLVQTQNGEWWCVTLGKRLVDGQVTLARETFLAKVDFEGQTPIFNKGEGKMLDVQKRPDLPWTLIPPVPERDHFDADELGLVWNFIRVPKQKFYELKDGGLVMNLLPEVADSLKNSAMIIRRIEHHSFEASTRMKFKSKKTNEQAGLIIYRTNENYYQLLKNKSEITLVKSFKGEKELVAQMPYDGTEVVLKAVGNNLDVQFSFGESANKMNKIGDVQDLTVIADGNGNQFNGPGIGMYATSNGEKTKSKATFDWFEYKGRKDIVRSACANFDIQNDLLLVNFDCKTDVDDLHSMAALATIIGSKKYSELKYHAVAGTYGIQGGLYVPPNDLCKLAFGKHWTDAHNNIPGAVQKVKPMVLKVLQNKGDLWIAEAGQSDFSAALIKAVQKEMPEVDILKRVHIVQHSTWNEDVTLPEALAFVKQNTDYQKINDGNAVGNGTPGFRSPDYINWKSKITKTELLKIWQLAYDLGNKYNGKDGRYNNKAVEAGGLDFSDISEVCWILGLQDIIDVDDYFEMFKE